MSNIVKRIKELNDKIHILNNEYAECYDRCKQIVLETDKLDEEISELLNERDLENAGSNWCND